MKRIVSLILVLAVSVSGFAQASAGKKNVQKYLSSSDVDALVENYEALGDELENFADMDNMLDLDASVSPDFDSMNFLASLKSTPEMNAVFVKYGMGKDGFRKLYVIIWAFEVAAFERIIAANDLGENGIDLSGLMPAIESLRACINPADLKLVSSRWDDLSSVFGDPTADQSGDTSYDDPSDEVMTVDDFYGEDSGDDYDEEADYDEDAEYDD